jgi:hypothetical protein
VRARCLKCGGTLPSVFLGLAQSKEEFEHQISRKADFIAWCPYCHQDVRGDVNEFLFWQD